MLSLLKQFKLAMCISAQKVIRDWVRQSILCFSAQNRVKEKKIGGVGDVLNVILYSGSVWPLVLRASSTRTAGEAWGTRATPRPHSAAQFGQICRMVLPNCWVPGFCGIVLLMLGFQDFAPQLILYLHMAWLCKRVCCIHFCKFL